MTEGPSFQEQYNKKGRPFEELAQQLICNTNNVTVILDVVHNHKECKFDFQTSDGIKYEVKADTRSKDTGNFYVEFKQSFNKGDSYTDSGIHDSDAQYWVLLYRDSFYVIPKTVLLEECINYQRKKCCKLGAVYTIGYIIPVEKIKAHATVMQIDSYPAELAQYMC
jgi:hypothetical protein